MRAFALVLGNTPVTKPLSKPPANRLNRPKQYSLVPYKTAAPTTPVSNHLPRLQLTPALAVTPTIYPVLVKPLATYP